MINSPATRRKEVMNRVQQLWTQRSVWNERWREIAQYTQPQASRFQPTDKQQSGQRKDGSIVDNTATLARRTVQAGLHSGKTPPGLPWFALDFDDEDLLEDQQVKLWTREVEDLLRRVFSSSNTYESLFRGYGELITFGTWACFVRPSYENVIHLHSLTAGEYALAVNDEGRVDTLARKLTMTPRQMVQAFGRDAVSSTVRNMHDRHSDTNIPLTHLVAPRSDCEYGKMDNVNMPWASYYLEDASDSDQMLSESGFKLFPVLAPRWDLLDGDTYGTSPAMDCLSDVKELQLAQRRKAQAIDYQVSPPIVLPASLRDQQANRLPGGVMYAGPGEESVIRSAYEVRVDLRHLKENIEDVRSRIREAYYVDLFRMFSQEDRTGRTATEILERREEKLIALGPIERRLDNELLSPLIDITFDRCVEVGLLPPAPEALQGRNVRAEFVSPIAQAMRAVSANNIDRFTAKVGQIAQMSPESLGKVDFDQMIDAYADAYSVDPTIVVPDDVLAERRAQQQQAQQAQETAANVLPTAQAAKTLGDTDTDKIGDMIANLTQGS